MAEKEKRRRLKGEKTEKKILYNEVKGDKEIWMRGKRRNKRRKRRRKDAVKRESGGGRGVVE